MCRDYLESAYRDLPMPRTPRKQQWTDEACYHVMNRGHNRERIFGDDDDRRQFLRLLARYQERFGLRLQGMGSRACPGYGVSRAWGQGMGSDRVSS